MVGLIKGAVITVGVTVLAFIGLSVLTLWAMGPICEIEGDDWVEDSEEHINESR